MSLILRLLQNVHILRWSPVTSVFSYCFVLRGRWETFSLSTLLPKGLRTTTNDKRLRPYLRRDRRGTLQKETKGTYIDSSFRRLKPCALRDKNSLFEVYYVSSRRFPTPYLVYFLSESWSFTTPST